MTNSIFGFTQHAPLDAASIAFVGIVAYIVIAEHCLSTLNELTKNTCYSDMIQHLYKDLSITGIMSFVLTLLTTTKSLGESEYVIYLEIAEITLFFATLFHVLFSAILIVRNRSYANCLSQKLQVESVDLINKYKSLTPFEQSSWCIWTIGIRREMELRVFRIVFHSYYKLTRNFDFVKYLTLCKESNIIHLLTVNPAHWLTLIVLLAGNYGFVQYFTLSDQEIEFVRNRFCDGVINQKECTSTTSQVFMFTVVVFAHAVVAMVLAYASRLCEVNILKAAGPKLPQEYSAFILKDERFDLENTDSAERMSWIELKSHIQVLKSSKTDTDGTILEIIPRKLSDGTKKVWKSASNLLRNMSKSNIVYASEEDTTQSGSFHYADVGSDQTSQVESSGGRGTVSYIRRGSILNAPSYKMNEPDIETGNSTKQNLKYVKSSKLCDSLNRSERKLDVFLLDSPRVYYFVRGTLNWSYCIVLAFYTCSFSLLAFKTKSPILWTILIIGLLVLIAMCQYYTIHASSFIYAFSKLDKNVIGQIIEENEEKSQLERKLRKKLITKLQNAVGEQYTETKMAVMQLFGEIKGLSDQSDGYLSKRELRMLLQRLDIHFSERRFNETFHLFDRNVDGTISLIEFYDFIFPEKASLVKRQERKDKYRASVGISIKNMSAKSLKQNHSQPLPIFKPKKKKESLIGSLIPMALPCTAVDLLKTVETGTKNVSKIPDSLFLQFEPVPIASLQVYPETQCAISVSSETDRTEFTLKNEGVNLSARLNQVENNFMMSKRQDISVKADRIYTVSANIAIPSCELIEQTISMSSKDPKRFSTDESTVNTCFDTLSSSDSAETHAIMDKQLLYTGGSKDESDINNFRSHLQLTDSEICSDSVDDDNKEISRSRLKTTETVSGRSEESNKLSDIDEKKWQR